MRPLDWRERLSQYVRDSKGDVFEWGRTDCALWSFGAVALLTGKDFREPYSGKYTTELGAKRALKKQGFDSLIDAVDSYLGPQIHPGFAQAGDIGAVATKSGPALGIVLGNGIYVMTPDGLGYQPFRDIIMAWRVQ